MVRSTFSDIEAMVVRWIPLIGLIAAMAMVTSPAVGRDLATRILLFTIGSST
jgi:hypothetical protein